MMESLKEGILGYFTPVSERTGNFTDWRKGHIRNLEHGRIQITTLQEDPMTTFAMAANPQGFDREPIIGMTELGPIALLNRPSRGYRATIGSRASVDHFTADTIVYEDGAEKIHSDNMRSARLKFLGASQWAGMSSLIEKHSTDEMGRANRFELIAESTNSLTVRVSRGRKLTVETDWIVNGPDDSRRVSAPIKFSISAAKAVSSTEILDPLLSIQDLLSLALDGFLLAVSGTAEVHGSARSLKLWNRQMMTMPEASKPPKPEDFYPLFTMETIGGAKGISRWIDISKEHWKAVGPLTSHRHGHSTIEAELIAMCVGLEYWHARFKRAKQWRNPNKSIGLAQPEIIAVGAGREFPKFVGDLRAWSKKVWTTYNALKHDPLATFDPHEIWQLARSARLLLVCLILNEVAKNKKPAQRILRHPDVHSFGMNLRSMLAPPPEPGS